MDRVIRDSDDEGSDATIEASPAKQVAYPNLADLGVEHVNSSALANARGTSSTEKLVRELETAHSAFLDETPLTQPSPVEAPSMASSSSKIKAPPKRSRTADSSQIRPSSSAPRKRAKRSHSINAISGEAAHQSRRNAAAKESIWEFPNSSQDRTEPDDRTQHLKAGNTAGEDDFITIDQRAINLVCAQEASASLQETIMKTSLPDTAGGVLDRPGSTTRSLNGAPPGANDLLVAVQEASAIQRIAPESQPVPKKRKATPAVEEVVGSIEPNSDELIGLPKEMYVPRPSRSRGGRTLPDQPVKPVNQPTKATKAKPKRRKTTGWVLSSGTSQLRDMGFTGSQAEQALIQADGKVDFAIEILTCGTAPQTENARRHTLNVVSEEVEDELAASQKDSFPKLIRIEDSVEDNVITVNSLAQKNDAGKSEANNASRKGNKTAGTEIANLQGSDSEDELVVRRKAPANAMAVSKTVRQNGDVVVVISGTDRSIQDQGSNTKRGKAAIAKKPEIIREDSEDELQQQDNALEKQRKCEEAQTMKKGRARARQPAALEAPVDDESIPDNEEANPDPGPDGRSATPGRIALQEKSPNKPQPTPVSSRHDPEPTVLTTPEGHKAGKASPHKRHSPLSFGRIPLKVGLSRRMRVEPLLRIIRK